MEAGAVQPGPTLALDQIQGNLAGFNKPNQRFVFLAFPDQASAQGFLRVTLREIDTAGDVAEFNRKFKRARDRGKELPTSKWFNLCLSFSGLQVLGAPELDSFSDAFKQGMVARAPVIGDVDDSAPANWVSPFGQTIHAVAILAADDPDGIERVQKNLNHHIHAHKVTELGRVDGAVRPGDARGHEHFGFKDGISQPFVEGLSTEQKPGQGALPAGEFILGYPHLDAAPPPPPPPGSYNPPPAPVPDTFPSWAKDGSFFVWRRLRQNVKGFNDFVAKAAGEAGLPPALIEAKLVGRYKSGAPLELTADEAPDFDPQAEDPAIKDPSLADDDAKNNNFVYEPQDADGHLVPRAAHIRKTYPRNATPPGQEESDRHRILRRGIPYGPEFKPDENPYPDAGNPPGDQDRGLIFGCYQASIERGFEFIQTQWANKEDFPQQGDGRDPIISQDVSEPTFSMPPDHTGDAHLFMQRWVITTGGEYFFSPSIAAIHQLAGALD